jgi:hypothetical protein
LLKSKLIEERGSFEARALTARCEITVAADGAGVVSHAGSRCWPISADRTTLTGELSEALDGVRGSWPQRDPRRGGTGSAFERSGSPARPGSSRW